MSRTTAATLREIERSERSGSPAKTIFVGGGTPTYLPAEQITSLLAGIAVIHPLSPDSEVTSESNPGTADSDKYAAMREAGFNRLSLGAQSFLDDDLLRLERVHSSDAIGNAVRKAREAGFTNINLDLMFALPGQSRYAWNRNLDRALELEPEHLSLYCLTIEPNTNFYKRHLRGELDLPDDEAQVAMYEDCLDSLDAAGYQQYEISNFAKPGYECRHNLAYWNGEEYAGYGPGAVGYLNGVRYTNLKHPERYCDAVETGRPLRFDQEQISPQTHKVEQVMLGLRLNQGIPLCLVDESALPKLLDRKWIEVDADRIRLTRSGRHFCSEVALELI